MSDIEKAIKVLQKEFAKGQDGGTYYYGWQSNIACCIMDNFPNIPDVHERANKAAKEFLNLLVK